MESQNKAFTTMLILTLVLGVVTFFQIRFAKNVTQEAEIIQQDSTSNVTKSDLDKINNEKNQSSIEFNDIGSNSRFTTQNKAKNPDTEIVYENDYYKIVFDSKQGFISNAYIKDTFTGVSKEEGIQLYDIVRSNYMQGALKLNFGEWKNDNSLFFLTEKNGYYDFERKDNQFIFYTTLIDNVEKTSYTIKKIYTFIENENLFKFDIQIKNNDKRSISFDNSEFAYSIGWGPKIGDKALESDKRRDSYDKIILYKDEKLQHIKSHPNSFLFIKNEHIPYQVINKNVNDSWIAFDSQYFTALMYPVENNYDYFFDFTDEQSDNYYAGFMKKSEKSIIESSYYIYMGPKINDLLKKYDNYTKNGFNIEDSNISKINKPVLWGLGDLIAGLLKMINKVIKNYGFSIILLTLLIKLVLFPLTYKSLESQQKMSQIQPKIKELQVKYKDKPDMLNKKTMEMYSKEGVNPLGGCLPMLLQMPILISMYQLISRMVELKGSSFLWITDLSMPDAIYQFNFTIPLLNTSSLNILPIIMVISQVISGFFTTTPTAGNKQAKMMMWMMPLMFFFFFYNVSSGLVLYWTAMNIFSLIQQLIVNQLKKKKA